MKTFCKTTMIVVFLLFCTNGIQAQTTQAKLNKVCLDNTGKAIAPDHFWLNYIDHLKSELNHCKIVLYDKDNLTG
jgi:hypothetical protein